MPRRSTATAPRRRRSSADLCCLLACLLSACTLGGPGHELIIADAGTKHDASAPGATPPSAASSGNASAGGSNAVGSTTQTSAASAAGAGAGSANGAAAIGGGARGSAGTTAAAPTRAPTAGSPMADDAGVVPGTDQTTCSFNFAACVTLNPLGFVDCATQAGPNCPEILFGGDAGRAPSPACSMQEATCLMNNPGDVDMCMAMLATCKL